MEVGERRGRGCQVATWQVAKLPTPFTAMWAAAAGDQLCVFELVLAHAGLGGRGGNGKGAVQSPR